MPRLTAYDGKTSINKKETRYFAYNYVIYMATRYQITNVDTDQCPVSHIYDLLTSRPGRGRGTPVTAVCVSNSCRLDMSTTEYGGNSSITSTFTDKNVVNANNKYYLCPIYAITCHCVSYQIYKSTSCYRTHLLHQQRKPPQTPTPGRQRVRRHSHALSLQRNSVREYSPYSHEPNCYSV